MGCGWQQRSICQRERTRERSSLPCWSICRIAKMMARRRAIIPSMLILRGADMSVCGWIFEDLAPARDDQIEDVAGDDCSGSSVRRRRSKLRLYDYSL